MSESTPGAAPSRPYTPMAALDLSQHGGTWMLDERAESVAKAALTGAWRQARKAYPDAENDHGCAPHIRITVEFVPSQHMCRYCGQQIAAVPSPAELEHLDILIDANASLANENVKLRGQLAEAQAAAVRAGKGGG